MATLTVQIVSANGTTNKTLTFSSADASRIMAAYQALKVNPRNPGAPPATQQDLADDLAAQLRDYLRAIVTRKETVYPTAPDLT